MSADSFTPASYYLRNPRTLAVTREREVIFIAENGATIRHPTSQAGAWSRLLQSLSSAKSGAELVAADELPEDIDAQLLDRLLGERILLHSEDSTSFDHVLGAIFCDNPGFDFSRVDPLISHLVFACSGSIVAGLMAPVLLSLRYSGVQRNLDVILTESAQRFVTPDLLEHYGIRTWCDPFARRDDVNVAHVQLGSAASCIVVLPATAATLQRLASGACTDLLSMTVAASNCPLILAPVMNTAMWNQPAVQRNLKQLREDGASIIEPTLIFGAADLHQGGDPMYGGHGTLWTGPRGLRHVIAALV